MSYEFEESIREALLFEHGYSSYDWSIVRVYQRPEDGRLFLYSGSGCSCDAPYDDFHSWGDLRPVTSFDPVRKALDDLYTGRPTATEVIVSMQKFIEALRKVEWGL